MLTIRTIPVGPIWANCYVVKLRDRPDGLVIDPGGDPAAIADECAGQGMTPAAILLTHGHFDHTGGVQGLLDRFPGTPVYLHAGDVTDDPRAQLAWCPTPGARFYGDGDVLELAGLPVEVLHTPGHSPGSVCLRVGQALFSGDTLFRGSVGRTDFPNGSYADLMASLRRLAGLEGDLKVYPGHEQSTTLEWERQNNFFMREALG